MRAKLLDFIKNRRDSFRITYWDGYTSLLCLEDVYGLCVASLVRDFKFNEKISLKYKDNVEIKLTVNEDVKIGRYVYMGITGREKGRIHIKLDATAYNKGTLTYYYIDAIKLIGVMKKIDKIGRLGNKIRLGHKELMSVNIANPNQVRTVNESLVELIEQTGIPLSEFYSFTRTKILLLLKGAINNFTFQDSPNDLFIKFSELFPIGIYRGEKICDLNHQAHLMTQRGYDNSLIRFSEIEDLLEFVKTHNNDKFLIITDKFSQFYDQDIYQTLVETILDDINLDRISVLIIPPLKALNHIHYDNQNLIQIENNVFTPLITTQCLPLVNSFDDSIIEVNSPALMEKYKRFDRMIQEQKKIYQPTSDLLNKIKWCSFTLFGKNSRTHQAINQFCEDISMDSQHKDAAMSICDHIFKHQDKLTVIKKQLQSNKYQLFYWNNIANDEVIEDLCSERIVSRLSFNPQDYVDETILISYIDKYFIRDQIFPALVFGHITMKQIKFVLYPQEILILKNMYRSFKKKIQLGVNNSRKLLENISEIDEKALGDDWNWGELPDYSTELNPKVGSYYVSANMSKDNDPVTEITTYFFQDNAGNLFCAYLTKNIKPNILNNDQIQKIDLEKAKIGHTFLFFGEGGIRDVLHNFPFLYYGNEREKAEYNKMLSLKDLWRKPLLDYKNKYSEQKLLETLRKNKIDVDHLKINRWMNDENLISPQNPEKIIPLIAIALNSDELKKTSVEVATVCSILQTKAKMIGKIIRKVALKKYVDIEQESFYMRLSDEQKK